MLAVVYIYVLAVNFMTIIKLSYKKVLAREVLLFFFGVGLLLILWGLLLVKNFYINNKLVSSSEKLILLNKQIDTLPTDNVKELYDKISSYFVITYKIGEIDYSICKEQEKDFLYDEYGIKKNVTVLSNNPNGYFYYKQADPLNILPKDSTLVFNFVQLNKFKEYLMSDAYLFNLFSAFSNSEDKSYVWDGNKPVVVSNSKKPATKNVDELPDLSKANPQFDKFQPYVSTFDLGSKSDFINRIRRSLTYDTAVNLKRVELINQKTNTLEIITSSKKSLLTQTDIWNFIIKAAIFLGIILYPLRLSFQSIKWAVMTLKKNK